MGYWRYLTACRLRASRPRLSFYSQFDRRETLGMCGWGELQVTLLVLLHSMTSTMSQRASPPLQSPGQRAPLQALLLPNPMLALCPILAHFPPLQSTPTWKKATPTCNKLFPTPRTFTLLGELAFVSRYFETGHTRLSAFDLTPDDPCQPQICYGLKSGFHSVLVSIINVYERLQICHAQLGASVHLTLGELYQAVQQFSDC